MDGWVTCTLCTVTKNELLTGVAFDDKGFVYFTTEEKFVYRIRKDEENQIAERIFHVEGGTSAVAWNKKKNALYLCSNSRNPELLECNLDTRVISPLFEFNTKLKESFPDVTMVSYPDEVVMDSNGNLYVMNSFHIFKVDMERNTIEIIAGSKTPGYQDGKTTQAQFAFLARLCVTEDGVLYVTDNQNHCIRRIKDGIVSTIAGKTGQIYQDAVDGPLLEAIFKYPFGIAAISKNELIVSDDYGLRKVDLTRNRVSTLLVFKGEPIYHIAVDTEGSLYVGTQRQEIWKISSNWKYEKLLWIGNLKEDALYCHLARLPKDLIVEIATHIRGTRSGPFGRCAPSK